MPTMTVYDHGRTFGVFLDPVGKPFCLCARPV
jgi:hypothetical protein